MCPFKWTMRTTDREAKPSDVKSDDRLVGFHQEGEMVFVAVRSYLPGVKLTDEIAKALARDYLTGDRYSLARNRGRQPSYSRGSIAVKIIELAT